LALPGRSFFGLTETELEKLPYPNTTTAIPNFFVPRSDAANPPRVLVFAVRTTEGRYAKCAAWQDSTGRLHLRYHTFDNRQLPLFLLSNWNRTRGEQVGSSSIGPIRFTEYAVAWSGLLRAQTQTLRAPISYRWQWDGRAVTGVGTLPGTTASHSIFGGIFNIETQMGQPLLGDLCVTARDASGFEVTACRQIDLPGTERVRQPSPFDDVLSTPGLLSGLALLRGPTAPPPDAPAPQDTLASQVTRALAVGMKVSEQRIKLR
jgi:hypothetical protein